MQTKLTLVVIMIFGFLITGCKQKEQKVEVEEVKIDLVNDELTIKLAYHGFHNLQNMMNNKFIESDVYLAPEVKAG